MKKVKQILIFGIIALLSQQQSKAQTILFEIDRSRDKDKVRYTINESNQQIDVKKPLDIYWVTQTGEKKPLTKIQKNFSYGVTISSVSNQELKFNLKALPEQTFITSLKNNSPTTTTNINNKTLIVNSLFISFKAGTSWSADIDSIQVLGIHQLSKESTIETIHLK